MHRKANRLHSWLIALIVVLLFVTACNRGAGNTAQPSANDDQAAATTVEAAPLTASESTAEAALQAAVDQLQATTEEEPVSAAGGAEGRSGVDPTATAPVLSEGPSATISPNAGSANTQVTIIGSGFPANTRVDVYLK